MIKFKKIAFIISSLSSGGAERVVSNLSNGLIENFEIIIITFEKSEPFYELDKRIKVISCIEKIKPSNFIIQSLNLNFLLAKKIYQTFKNENIHLAIGFITSANILTTIAAKIYGIPCIISERNNPMFENVPRLWVFMRNIIYPMANTLVVQTNGVKKLYEKSIKSKKIVILPNPIANKLSELRDINSKKEKLILTVGRLNKNKGHTDIIKIFSSINNDIWKLLIIGDGEEKQNLLGLIKNLNLNNKVKIISSIKQIDKYYNISSIFVFASKSEGFPNALLEAMHFGLPCVAFDCDFGPSELIKDSSNGFLIPLGETNAFKRKLMELIYNATLRQKLSLNAIKTTELYMFDTVINDWRKLINTLLEKQT